MLQRELSYEVPFERLPRLSQSAGRKAYPATRWLTRLLLALFAASILAIFQYGKAISFALRDAAIPYGIEIMLFGALLLFVLGALVLRRLQLGQVKSRARFAQTSRMKGTSADPGAERAAVNAAARRPCSCSAAQRMAMGSTIPCTAPVICGTPRHPSARLSHGRSYN